MVRMMLEAEIESHVCFPLETPDAEIHATVPPNIELYLRNGNVELGTANPTLIAGLIFEGSSMDAGIQEGREKLTEILQNLAATTSCTIQYGKTLQLVDWSEGKKERLYKVSQPFPGHSLPYDILQPSLVYSALRLWAANNDVAQSLVHWFSSGIAARQPADQFQLFWFMMEVLGEHKKPTTKVPDLCQVCRSPLYCEYCEEHPTHKPFNKQSIEILIRKATGGDEDGSICKRLFRTRNMLLHGSPAPKIEVETGKSMNDLVNELAIIAHQSLIEFVETSVPMPDPNSLFEFIQISDFTHGLLSMTANMQCGPVDANYDEWRKQPLPQLSLKVGQRTAHTLVDKDQSSS